MVNLTGSSISKTQSRHVCEGLEIGLTEVGRPTYWGVVVATFHGLGSKLNKGEKVS